MGESNGVNRGEKIVRVEQACEVDTAFPVAVIMRVYYSSYHLWAAQHFSALARKMENEEGSRAMTVGM